MAFSNSSRPNFDGSNTSRYGISQNLRLNPWSSDNNPITYRSDRMYSESSSFETDLSDGDLSQGTRSIVRANYLWNFYQPLDNTVYYQGHLMRSVNLSKTSKVEEQDKLSKRLGQWKEQLDDLLENDILQNRLEDGMASERLEKIREQLQAQFSKRIEKLPKAVRMFYHEQKLKIQQLTENQGQAQTRQEGQSTNLQEKLGELEEQITKILSGEIKSEERLTNSALKRLEQIIQNLKKIYSSNRLENLPKSIQSFYYAQLGRIIALQAQEERKKPQLVANESSSIRTTSFKRRKSFIQEEKMKSARRQQILKQQQEIYEHSQVLLKKRLKATSQLFEAEQDLKGKKRELSSIKRQWQNVSSKILELQSSISKYNEEIFNINCKLTRSFEINLENV